VRCECDFSQSHKYFDKIYMDSRPPNCCMRAIAIDNDRTEIFENVESVESEGGGDVLVDELSGISPDMIVLLPDK